jgi:hypothetical protein
MNVLFLSPHFPPHFHLFCAALRQHGAVVLGVGEAAPEQVAPETMSALDHYAHVPGMEDYDCLLRAVAWLIAQHGHIERVESHNEHWLEREARLREDFNMLGAKPDCMARWRSKAHMAHVFAEADVPHPPGVCVTRVAEAVAFAQQQGFPLIVKPDVGVAAQGVQLVHDEEGLRAAVAATAEGTCCVVQRFVPGPMVSFDGLTDAEGRIVYAAAHENSSGVLQIAQHQLDMHYCSLRTIPPELESIGRRAVRAFDLRERFFHFETLRQDDGHFIALEINVRPPGGFTTDMMNFASDIDVYDLWARMLVGDDLSGFVHARPYHCAHVSRRRAHRYRLSHAELVERLGSMLVMDREMPAVLSLMGDHVYLVRHPEMAAMRQAFAWAHEPSR